MKRSGNENHTFSVGRVCQCLVTMSFALIITAVSPAIKSQAADGFIGTVYEASADAIPEKAVKTVKTLKISQNVKMAAAVRITAGEAEHEDVFECSAGSAAVKKDTEALYLASAETSCDLTGKENGNENEASDESDKETAADASQSGAVTSSAADDTSMTADLSDPAVTADDPETASSAADEEASQSKADTGTEETASETATVLASASEPEVLAAAGVTSAAVFTADTAVSVNAAVSSDTAVPSDTVSAVSVQAALLAVPVTTVSAADVPVSADAAETAAAVPANDAVQQAVAAPAAEATASVQADASAVNSTAADTAAVAAASAPAGVSPDDYNALCRIVQAEAGNEPQDGKLLVADVIINRVADPSFPNSIQSVINQGGQFTPVSNGAYSSAVPSADTIAAVNRALAGENISQGALYFKSVRSSSSWSTKTLLFNYGNHNFYR